MKKTPSSEIDRQKSILGVLAENAAQAVHVQQALAELAAGCATNIVEGAVAVQTEITRLTLNAVLHGDPGALMSLGERAVRAGFRESMDCAARNLKAAQSAGTQILDTVSTPPGGVSGTP